MQTAAGGDAARVDYRGKRALWHVHAVGGRGMRVDKMGHMSVGTLDGRGAGGNVGRQRPRMGK